VKLVKELFIPWMSGTIIQMDSPTPRFSAKVLLPEPKAALAGINLAALPLLVFMGVLDHTRLLNIFHC